jgi:hypothetical protein
MPVDEDVFAFRLRQSDDFACSVQWNQNRIDLKFRKSNLFAAHRAQSRCCGEINRANVRWRNSS